MIKFEQIIQRFRQKGEKTGWSYITIDPKNARKLKPNTKVSFRVKGRLDSYAFEALALLPMGEGDFILPLNATIRKAIRKKEGDKLKVEMELDDRPLALSPDLMKSLKMEPAALAHFKSMPRSHQNYFSKWIESAKTLPTKTKRIVMAVNAMAHKMKFNEMLRAARSER